MEFRAISADCHINEPPDVWRDRLPVRLRDKAPRMVQCAGGGDGWSWDGKIPGGRGMNSMAGQPFEERGRGLRFAEISPGHYDGKAHLEEQKKDGVYASVIYAGAAMSAYNLADRELGVEVMRAYNDWLIEDFCVDPRRLVGMALLPVNDGMEATLAEFRRCVGKGYRGFFLPAHPTKPVHDPYYDPLWGAAQEAGVPLSFHRNHGDRVNVDASDNYAAGVVIRDFSAIQPLSNLIYTAAFDRFPGLKVVSAETNFGWMPFWIERMEQEFNRHRYSSALKIRRRPRDYVWDNVYVTALEDSLAYSQLELVPVDNIMWSNDYPHGASLWPRSQEHARTAMAGVSKDAQRKILEDNASRLYKIEKVR